MGEGVFKVKLFGMRFRCIEKGNRAVIHSGRRSIGFDQIELGDQAGMEGIDPDNDAVAPATGRRSPGLLPPVLVHSTPPKPPPAP